MEHALVLLNHLWHFFLLPIAWALLFCLGTQLVFRQRARQAAPWLRRSLLAGAAGCALTLVLLPLNGGNSSVAYYGALLLVLSANEAWQLKIWRA